MVAMAWNSAMGETRVSLPLWAGYGGRLHAHAAMGISRQTSTTTHGLHFMPFFASSLRTCAVLLSAQARGIFILTACSARCTPLATVS